jgi:hypothetical protein
MPVDMSLPADKLAKVNAIGKAILFDRASVKKRFHGAGVPCGGQNNIFISACSLFVSQNLNFCVGRTF